MAKVDEYVSELLRLKIDQLIDILLNRKISDGINMSESLKDYIQSGFSDGFLQSIENLENNLEIENSKSLQNKLDLADLEFKDKSDYRMMLVVRNDLKMGKGKIAAQCCHAAVSSYEAMTKKRQYLLKPWLKNGTAKIAVKVESEEELLEVERKAKELKILTKIVRDAGHTQVAPMSRTVLSLGPAPKKILDQVTGHLKLL
ncbi:peptidyl-tRNA hydrolase 2, mitochondrial-like isoform X1 [Harmonia axyridis]|uniref:peptidyl-tRNA hydrolase 2, mitochondrial-like isoform X1 n=1 Tax=Harmonia axyridis TaxID=115357 RepID=UPI001E279BE1|nr:peptidyl-tRNA hydrolase 2, mitochondrial-like isoform X1 [Harmonia axyridis]